MCDEIAKFHNHPFMDLGECVLENERLEFLKWGKAHPTLHFDIKAEYIKGAEEWAKARGRPGLWPNEVLAQSVEHQGNDT